jgi:hypothetical protein
MVIADVELQELVGAIVAGMLPMLRGGWSER